MILLIISIALLLIALYFYNRAVKLRVLVKEAWSGIDVHLRERRNLIPALVETVKGYASHEQETFKNVIEKRNSAFNASSTSEIAIEENGLSTGVAKIFALAEDYPDLKASDNFINLQEQIVAIEDKLQYARRYHNGTVRDYNTFIQSIPFVFVAKPLNFQQADFFEIELATERNLPHVSLN